MAARPSRGASLLRTSRMFSLPQPLPKPDLGLAATTRYSDTSTTPYPLHQAVTTPKESLVAGDWGLKRALPKSRLAATSTRVVRINEIDAMEAVTDYNAAAAHTLLGEKFQEMNVPIMVRAGASSAAAAGDEMKGLISVFEEDFDVTDHNGAEARNNPARWRFKGPWLAKLSENEFRRFLAKEVRSRKAGFREFLRARLAQIRSREAATKAMDSGLEAPPARQPSSVTDEELVPYLRHLRGARRVHLASLVSQFLDLPPAQPHEYARLAFASLRGAPKSPFDEDGNSSKSNKSKNAIAVRNPYAVSGPPVTHPSAGISYLRTAAFLENHPLYGPQEGHSPVLSRIITPRRRAGVPKLGVGGFVVSYPDGLHSGRRFQQYWRDMEAENEDRGLSVFDPTIKGGAAAYLVPRVAQITPNGRVELRAALPNAMQELVKREEAGAGHVYLKKPPKEGEDALEDQTSHERAHQAHEKRQKHLQSFRGMFSSSKSYGLT